MTCLHINSSFIEVDQWLARPACFGFANDGIGCNGSNFLIWNGRKSEVRKSISFGSNIVSNWSSRGTSHKDEGSHEVNNPDNAMKEKTA